MKVQAKFWARNNMLEIVEFIVQWLAALIFAFVSCLHDLEMKDVKEALRSIASKLEIIELALREK